MNKKQKYHHGDLPDALVKAAVSLLTEKGPESLSLREVARLAGVSHGAPAHHFGDKAGLLTAVAIAGYQILAGKLKAATEAAVEEGRHPLREAGSAYVNFAVEYQAYFNIMFRPRLINVDSELYQDQRDAAHGVLAQCLRDIAVKSKPDGVAVSEPEIETTAMLLWSQVHGFSHLWLAGNMGDPDDHERFKVLLEQMFNTYPKQQYEGDSCPIKI